MTDKFITKEQVSEITGLSTVTIWRMEKSGDFPPRRQISKKRVAYLESELNDWMMSRITSGAKK